MTRHQRFQINRNVTHARRHRTSYSLQFKLRVCDTAQATTVKGTARLFGVSPKTIRDWRANLGNIRALPEIQRIRRLTLHTGPVISFEEVERLLKAWHTQRVTIENQGVTINQLMTKAIEFEPTLRRMNTNTLRSKIRRFMQRHDLVLRRVTSHIHVPQDELETSVNAFVEDVQNYMNIEALTMANVFNMDQTSIFYDMPPAYTVVQRGASQNRILTSNNEKKRVSVLLSVRGDGVKCKPLIVYKGAPFARIYNEVRAFDDDFALHTVQDKAWTDLTVLRYWCTRIWSQAAGETDGQKLLLVDSLKLHTANRALFYCDRDDIEVKFIPSNCTGLIQPLDISVIRAFKLRVMELWNNHDLLNEEVTREVISDWIKQAWDDVPIDVITNSFSKLANEEERMEIE